MKRRTLTVAKNLPPEVLTLPRGVAEQQYADRAARELNLPDIVVCDLGWKGVEGTTNACFWLCLAAGWTQVKNDATASDPWHGSTLFEDRTRALRDEVMGLLRQKVHHARPPLTGNAIGKLAQELRKHFCGSEERPRSLTSPPLSPTGEVCVMRRPDVVDRFFPAYAALSPGSVALCSCKPSGEIMSKFCRNDVENQSSWRRSAWRAPP